MKSFILRHKILVTLLVLLVLVGGIVFSQRDTTPTWITETVSQGDVAHIVSVSGVLEAEEEAMLTFLTTGIVDSILVREGDRVDDDQVLATLEQYELQAELRDASAALVIAEADRNELISGPRSEERDLTATAVLIAEADLERITREENTKVENAYRTLLSDDLEALPVDKGDDAVPPRITGTYTCGEGAYRLSVFRSGASSGYSYRLSGVETGTYTAYTESPAPLGLCGLSIQFIEGETYGNNEWTISIPNTRSASYATNQNAYTLALTARENAIQAAEQAVTKARQSETLENATPRDEDLDRADALVTQAEARIASIQARIDNRTLFAPFPGTITDVDLVPGEVASNGSIALVGDAQYELSMRIPEIDITRLSVGQIADITFDARPDEVITSSVSFISKTATEIDGVAYFEAKIAFTNPPEWFRSGLNADVNIVVDRRENELRLPKRFIQTREDGTAFVLIPEGTKTREETVRTTFIGNDGYAALEGIPLGTTVVAP